MLCVVQVPVLFRSLTRIMTILRYLYSGGAALYPSEVLYGAGPPATAGTTSGTADMPQQVRF
jgi:hypothetical protein